jgi:hypothetical protein
MYSETLNPPELYGAIFSFIPAQHLADSCKNIVLVLVVPRGG